ncbi:1-phosphofructokinase [Croceicoccus estronivorus]|uniref:1-phosphofructokinase family hexose kinase n=1 Tax=Croceicoccus estronivorus TaxID=1172626 RepID=UPI00082C4798|nr:1-phosphofructokinase family hexose kinase [Croceicoccus estronivorus]OCC25400.1 1-phosphofructokinase [Croceicoccus estronivorus]
MPNIATLTLNPTIDTAYEVDHVVPTHKMRTLKEHYDPGGGGINVARVFVRLGGNARCYYLSGGATGVALDGLLDLHQLVRCKIPIAGETRVSSSVYERSTGKEYRVVPSGPTIAPDEWQACLDQLTEAQCEYLVASGSLPPGVPDDFYAKVSAITAKRGIKFVLDSSGRGLKEGLAGGNIYLAKPSLGELRQLTGLPLTDDAAVVDVTMDMIERKQAELIAVTMGHEGALLVTRAGTTRLPALPIEAQSAVGAGDSFVAGMVFALASGHDPKEAFRYGIAAGSAAVLTPGTDLARPADIERLLLQVSSV